MSGLGSREPRPSCGGCGRSGCGERGGGGECCGSGGYGERGGGVGLYIIGVVGDRGEIKWYVSRG